MTRAEFLDHLSRAPTVMAEFEVAGRMLFLQVDKRHFTEVVLPSLNDAEVERLGNMTGEDGSVHLIGMFCQ